MRPGQGRAKRASRKLRLFAQGALSWGGAGLLTLGVLTFAGRARAFCRTTVCKDCAIDRTTGCTLGMPIAWPSSCVTFSLQHDGSTHVPSDAAQLAIDRAFASWQAARCPGSEEPPSIQVRTTFGEAACRRHEYNQTDGNANIVMFRDDDWPYVNATDALALTTVTYNANTGDIYDADMEINATERLSVEENPAPYAFDLQSIVTHEAGHFLGLNHSLDPAATMAPRYSAGTDGFRDLSTDDIAGVCAIYPPANARTCQEEPRQGFSPTCGITPTSGGSCAVAPPGWPAHHEMGSLFAGCLSIAFVRRRRRGRGPSV